MIQRLDTLGLSPDEAEVAPMLEQFARDHRRPRVVRIGTVDWLWRYKLSGEPSDARLTAELAVHSDDYDPAEMIHYLVETVRPLLPEVIKHLEVVFPGDGSFGNAGIDRTALELLAVKNPQVDTIFLNLSSL